MIKIKTEAGCVTNHDFGAKFRKLKKFDVDVSVMGEIITRKMVKVLINKQYKYVDVITGTIYDPKTGKSNSTKVWIQKVYKTGG